MTICVSYSGINLYNQCPSAFQRRYITKEETVDSEPSAAMQRGTRVHKGVELYLLGEVDELPDEALSFEGLFEALRNERNPQPELEWAFDADWNRVEFADKESAQVRGMLDIAYEHKGVAHVKELKTGKVYDDHALQRSLYGLAGALLFPDTHTIQVDTIYLDGGMVKPTVYARDMVDTSKWTWQRHINKVQPPQPYPQRQSWKCKWCPYHENAGGTCNGETTK